MESYDFEHQLVGSMMVKGDHIDCREIAGKLPAEAFENFHLKSMYQAIVTLLNKAEPVDMFTVKDAVPSATKDFVVEVACKCSSAANIRGWAKRVRQCWMLRRGEAELKRAAELLAGAGTHDLNDRIAEVSGILSKLQFETNDKLPRRIGDLLDDYMVVLENRMKGEESGLYLKTGIQPMDDAYGGLDRTDLIVIAGRPGMGKTELAINIANSVGRQKGKGLLISMEMSDMQVVERHVADRAGLSVGTLRNPLNMIQEQYTRLTAATGTLLDEDNHVIDGSFTVDECIAHAERMNMDGGLSFLAIDYLGLIEKPSNIPEHQAIADITRKLKQFCLRNKVPVILLAQLNRGPEGRQEKRPGLGDLAKSGAIEQDADVIIFPYRDEVYDENSNMKGIAEIIIGKYRSGQPQTFYMGWKNGHFVNIDQQEAAKQYAANTKEAPKSDWRG
ncbi:MULTISPECIES: replicative DNA helicase [Enterobacter cloacae complex]|jgi:replicative DNA helicase|uniref:replicative DNA helicase n=1 Tax=Enterobacter cloacae complex TaxID=354276 RepID=UPI00187EAEE5|nr:MULTISPECIES: replicative DNA helicase [Enterobacter cloacae complex]ELQ9034847.1 DNA helicase [Enterobacter cloacae]DAG71071.1 MAG TPA: DnaB-like replicative helicase [Caudoviricetes sp.]MBE8915125.1 DNA helicase [Enterobacter kobei]MBT1888195.1 DNA helicase [Enterobacter roggenkampii]MCE1464244.1 replicative DNA helicase [Enterobacter roggenkampii]